MTSVHRTSSIRSINSYLIHEIKRFRIDYYKKSASCHETLEKFERLTTLGTGTYGRVILMKHKPTHKYFALKILEKKKVIRLNAVEQTLNEKRILESTRHPFLIHMKCFFQDNSYLYFVLPFIAGGELFGLVRKVVRMSEDMAKFYAAQVCLALEYLHTLNLVYRDLKPENILVDETGYIKVTDFGFCKLIRGRTYTFCGTPEYMAPEIILNQGYSFSVDWWSYGILIYELNAGYPPFRHKDMLVLFDKITSSKFIIPEHFSANLKDLLKHILQRDLSKRFGNLSNGAKDIRNHSWFKETNWVEMFNKTKKPPYMPTIDKAKLASNFPRYREEPLRISLTNRYKNEFAQF